MSHSAPAVLLIGLEPALLAVLEPLLGAAGVRAASTGSQSLALDLVQTAAFELLVVRHGAPGAALDSLLKGLSAAASPSVAVLLLADAADVPRLLARLGHGVNRVECFDARADRLLDAVADLVALAGVRRVRRVVQLEVMLRQGRMHELVVTKNLSLSGMLAVGGRRFAVGSRLAFSLRLPTAPVEGEAEVTRHTNRLAEHVEGIGVRFLRFEPDGEQRLRGFLSPADRPAAIERPEPNAERSTPAGPER